MLFNLHCIFLLQANLNAMFVCVFCWWSPKWITHKTGKWCVCVFSFNSIWWTIFCNTQTRPTTFLSTVPTSEIGLGDTVQPFSNWSFLVKTLLFTQTTILSHLFTYLFKSPRKHASLIDENVYSHPAFTAKVCLICEEDSFSWKIIGLCVFLICCRTMALTCMLATQIKREHNQSVFACTATSCRIQKTQRIEFRQ